MTKKNLQEELTRDSYVYKKLVECMELDLAEVQNSLCVNLNKDLIPILQGKAQKLIEYIKVLK